MTPTELHTAVLAALADAEAPLGQADASPGPWLVGYMPGPFVKATILSSPADGECRAVAYDVRFHDAHLVVGLVNTAAAAYAGARRTLERHEPSHDGPDVVCLNGCYSGDAPLWPCPDYRDAAAVIPHLPKEAADALAR
ncbi:hypothetical protein AB0A95_30480 [Micromonospora sp. NPDC049230]|uniref:hypothetical protein n=1 Tax=Micromonospora sp. NPDC049230 TaxID=3155502 RepID=UPI0033E77F5C